MRKGSIARRLALLAAAALIPLTTSCNADLADGNPCRAIAEASCNWLARCALLPAGQTASSCLTSAVNNGEQTTGSFPAPACQVSAGDARSCAGDLDSFACPATAAAGVVDDDAGAGGLPASCQAIGVNPTADLPIGGSGTTACDCPEGCCDSSGICKLGTLDSACGTTGGTCINCTAVSETCTGGTCF